MTLSPRRTYVSLNSRNFRVIPSVVFSCIHSLVIVASEAKTWKSLYGMRILTRLQSAYTFNGLLGTHWCFFVDVSLPPPSDCVVVLYGIMSLATSGRRICADVDLTEFRDRWNGFRTTTFPLAVCYCQLPLIPHTFAESAGILNSNQPYNKY